MPHNFWFDAFAADKPEPFTARPITNAERIESLKIGIEMYSKLAAENSERWAKSVEVRKANLAKLMEAA